MHLAKLMYPKKGTTDQMDTDDNDNADNDVLSGTDAPLGKLSKNLRILSKSQAHFLPVTYTQDLEDSRRLMTYIKQFDMLPLSKRANIVGRPDQKLLPRAYNLLHYGYYNPDNVAHRKLHILTLILTRLVRLAGLLRLPLTPELNMAIPNPDMIRMKGAIYVPIVQVFFDGKYYAYTLSEIQQLLSGYRVNLDRQEFELSPFVSDQMRLRVNEEVLPQMLPQ